MFGKMHQRSKMKNRGRNLCRRPTCATSAKIASSQSIGNMSARRRLRCQRRQNFLLMDDGGHHRPRRCLLKILVLRGTMLHSQRHGIHLHRSQRNQSPGVEMQVANAWKGFLHRSVLMDGLGAYKVIRQALCLPFWVKFSRAMSYWIRVPPAAFCRWECWRTY